MGIRDKKLIQEVRRSAYDRRSGLYVPRNMNDTRTTWPVCQTCFRDVDAFEMRDWNSEGVELWASCHGKEDFYTVKYPYRIENPSGAPVWNDHIKVAVKAFRPFQTSIALG